MEQPFVIPQFVGERFEQHGLPVSVAADLAAYEALLIEVAKHLYLKDHPERQRVPKGFTGVHLDIAGIEAGSVKPVLRLVSAMVVSSQLALLDGVADDKRYFLAARDLIAECVAAPINALPEGFPKKLLTHFNRLGRSLKEGEILRFASRDGSEQAELTMVKRRQLVLAAGKVYEREVDLCGFIEEVDWGKSSLRLRLDDGSAATVPMSDDFSELARQSGGKSRDRAFIKVIALYDSWERLQKVLSVDAVEVIRNYELAACFENLEQIQDGWFEGAGKAPNKERLREMARILIDYFPENVPLPAIVPTQDGNLLLEWQSEGMPSVDIDLATKTAAFHAFAEHDGDIEQDFQLADAKGIDDFFTFLSTHILECQS